MIQQLLDQEVAAVTAFAEGPECRLAYLNSYLGETVVQGCGRCDVCSSELLASQESIAKVQLVRDEMKRAIDL